MTFMFMHPYTYMAFKKKERSIHTQHMHYKLVEPKNAPYYCETPLPDLQKRKPSGIAINAILITLSIEN